MPYQRLRCPKGHNFKAHVVSRHMRVECPECKRAAEAGTSSSYSPPSVDYSFTASSYESSSSSSSSSDSFSSGGGGDYGGGGSSGDW